MFEKNEKPSETETDTTTATTCRKRRHNNDDDDERTVVDGVAVIDISKDVGKTYPFDKSNNGPFDGSSRFVVKSKIGCGDGPFDLSSFLDMLFFTQKTFTGADLLRNGIRYLCVFLVLFLICPHNAFLVLLLILILLLVLVYIVGYTKNKFLFSEPINPDRLDEFRKRIAEARDRNKTETAEEN